MTSSQTSPGPSRARRAMGVLSALAVATASMLGVAVTRAQATSGVAITDVPVSFTVKNVDRSSVGCATDGKTYTIRGHLTGPTALVSATSHPSGTLYLHGLEVKESFWRAPVIGAGYVRSMAALGHVSVTIDRLGYDSSGHPNGLKSCVGGQADVAHQIVQQLRAGTYGGALHPGFARLALAGHSLGGAITEIEANSFHDVDAIAVLSYADLAPTPGVLKESLTFGPKCLAGGATSGGAAGYAYLTSSVADYQANFLAHTPASVLPQALAMRSLNPCGDMISIIAAIPLDALNLSRIKVPVLVMSGSDDQVFDINRVA
ncbi:MAG: alpha/beta fold hydrolase, partial [Marmoricola sp.]